VNPAQYSKSFDFINVGYVNYNGINAFNNQYIIGSMNVKKFSFNFLTVFNYNDVRSSVLTGIGASVKSNSASFNITPLMKYEYFQDGENYFKKGLLAGTEVKAENLYSGVMFLLIEGCSRKTYLNVGYRKSGEFNLFMQVGMSNGIILMSGVEWMMGKYLKCNASVDSEKRFECGFSCSIGAFSPYYSAMTHPYLGLSNEAGVIIKRENRSYLLPEVKVKEMKSDMKIKMLKNETKFPININSATIMEIEDIPLIGRQTALKIYLKRVYFGGYNSYESIDSIYGIGKTAMEEIKKHTYIGE